MPKSRRDFQKRRLGYVLASIDRALERALEIRIAFDRAAGLDPQSERYDEELEMIAEKNSHARYALLIHTAMLGLMQCRRIFEEFALMAWGSVPDKVERWTNTGYDYRKAKDV